MYEYLNPFWHKINIVVHIFAFNFDRSLLDFQVQHMWIHVSTFYEFVLSLIQSYFNSVLLMICVLASLKIIHFLSSSNKDQSLIKRAVPINRFLYSTTVQNFTHLSYSFRVTTPIIGAGRWHGPKMIFVFYLQKA